jgi:general secretion pathway protein J
MPAEVTIKEKGFTLVEMLVALTLLGAIFAIIFGGLRITNHTNTVSKARAERADRILTSHRLLRRFIERAYPLSWKDGDKLRFAFEGGAKSLVFTAILPDYPSIAGPYTVKLYLNKAEGGEALWLNLTPYEREPGKGDNPKAIEDVILIPAPIDVALEYYGTTDDQNEARWFSNWSAEDQMPSLIRLSISDDDEADSWPDLVVSVGIDMDVGCLFQPGKEPEICRLDEEEAALLRKNAPTSSNAGAKKDDSETSEKDATQPVK